VTAPIILPWLLQSSLETASRVLLDPGDQSSVDFSRPYGEPALASADSVSWRVFKNPLSLFIGGVTAVIMELAEPRVRTGVWEHTTFRTNPIRRLRRTGLAAMVTVYGARGTAEAMIARVRRMHDMVAGTTSSGEAYCANDPELLNWVHATAAYGFVQAYHTYVRPLSLLETVTMLRGSQPLLCTVLQAHRHRKRTSNGCFRQRQVDWSARTLCLSFSPSCARHPFCRCC
jgi:uncharacterized protein (DUF2236 family)